MHKVIHQTIVFKILYVDKPFKEVLHYIEYNTNTEKYQIAYYKKRKI